MPFVKIIWKKIPKKNNYDLKLKNSLFVLKLLISSKETLNYTKIRLTFNDLFIYIFNNYGLFINYLLLNF